MVSHAKNCVDMAISMHRKVLEIKTRDGMSIHMRIGVHTGSIVGGCIGTKKIRFDIWFNIFNFSAFILGEKTHL